MTSHPHPSGGRRALAVAAALSVLAVLGIGAVVNSHQAALSVPDWPKSFGEWILVEKWSGNVVFEHSHRLAVAAASLVLLSFFVVEARAERGARRRKAVGLGVIFAVQVLLGAGVVLMLRPAWLATLHAVVAVGVAVGVLELVAETFGFRQAPARRADGRAPGRGEARLAGVVAGLVALQILLGALSRHPVSQGPFIVALLAHVATGLALAVLIPTLAVKRLRRTRGVDRGAAGVLLVLLVLQIGAGVGVFIVSPEPLSEEWPPPAGFVPLHVAHVLLATLLLAVASLLAARAARDVTTLKGLERKH